MARRKKEIPPEMLGEISQENAEWLIFYENHPKAPKTEHYRNYVREFLCYINHNQKSFTKFTENDADNFIGMLERVPFSGSGINNYIGAISGCARILREEKQDSFSPTFLINISKKRRKRQENECKPSSEYFTLRQISLIKKFTYEQCNDTDQFIFNELYYNGIQLVELQSIGKELLDSKIDYIHKANQYFLKITEHLKEMGEYFEENNINSEHFKQSHKDFFIRCPFCEQDVENISENWILVRTEFTDKYRIIHSPCKDKLE